MKKTKRSLLRGAIAALCVAATVGLLSLATAPSATAASKLHGEAAVGPAHKTIAPAAASSAVGGGNVGQATWMHDLAAHIEDRKLSEIIIPASHDSATYSLPPPGDDLWHTQSDDLIHQLNDGMRELDIRVTDHERGRCPSLGADCWYAHHGGGITDGISTWLSLGRIFNDLGDWATNTGAGAGPGPRDQEIILLALRVDKFEPDDPNYPTDDCRSFGQRLGDALITPNELQSHFGTTDPGQVTLADLWSLPDPKGYARVIMDNTDCLDIAVPGAGRWSGSITGGLYGGYYANQCNYSGISIPEGNQYVGMHDADLTAVKTRSLGNDGVPNGWSGGTFNSVPKVGGLYNLGIMGTPAFGCLYTPTQMVDSEKELLPDLIVQWETNPATNANLNIISGDFVQETLLWHDAMGMDEDLPEAPARLEPDAKNSTTVEADSTTSRGFAVKALDSNSAPIPGVPVTFDAKDVGIFSAASSTVTVKTGSDGVALSPPVMAGGYLGQRAITVSSPGAPTVSLPLTVTPGKAFDFKVTNGFDQSTPANTTFPVRVTGHWEDAYGNTTPLDPLGKPGAGFEITSRNATFAGAPGDGYHIHVNPDPNGTITAPPVIAGPHAGLVYIYPDNASSPAAVLNITPARTPPAAPTITGVVNGDQNVSVAFTDANPGTSPVTSYEVKATDQAKPTTAPVTATSQSSPVEMSGLVNGDPYVFTATATSKDGTSPISATFGPINVGKPPVFTAGPANGVVGEPYSSGFTFTGAPPPTITLDSGLPLGLTLGSDGKLTGIPTQAGTYDLTVTADNHVGQISDTVPITISEASSGSTTPSTAPPTTAPPTTVPPTTVAPASPTTAPTITAPPDSAPAITNLANGDAQVAVSFSGGSAGSRPNTSYEVTATDLTKPGTPLVTAKGQGSPITVTGLTNGDDYQFAVLAISATGDAQVAVAFSGGSAGSTPNTSYEVTATDLTKPGTPLVTAKGQGSPITVTGLTNGDNYQFAVLAISATGADSPLSPSNGRLIVGVGSTGGPANGVGSKSSQRGNALHQPPQRHAHGRSH